jgi:hypothetical protein
MSGFRMVAPEHPTSTQEEAVPAHAPNGGQRYIPTKRHPAHSGRDTDHPPHDRHHAAEENDPMAMASEPLLDSVQLSFVDMQKAAAEQQRSAAAARERVDDERVDNGAEGGSSKCKRKGQFPSPYQEPGQGQDRLRRYRGACQHEHHEPRVAKRIEGVAGPRGEAGDQVDLVLESGPSRQRAIQLRTSLADQTRAPPPLPRLALFCRQQKAIEAGIDGIEIRLDLSSPVPGQL